MEKPKVNIGRCGCLLLCLLLFVLLWPMISRASDQTEPEVVRVGWYEDSYHTTGMNGSRSGYGYEYEQAVAAYTGWQYEYVKGDFGELLEKLQNGEIDLMAALSYTDERAEKMLFSELPMGQEKYYLYVDLANQDISLSDLSTLNGKRILVLEDSVQATQFAEWEEKHHIKTQHIDIDSMEHALKMTEKHEVDGVISTETPIWVEAGMSAIAITGGSDIYYGISKERPDLKEALDSAMRAMEYDKPFYSDELYKEYLVAESVAVLSNEEKEWLSQHGAIRVGFLKNDIGVSSVNEENGELTGVINDYIDYAKNCLGNHALEFQPVGFDTRAEEVQALKDNQIDMIFHAAQNPYESEKNGFALSNTVWNVSLTALTIWPYFDESLEHTVAIPKDRLALNWYVSYNYPQWKIVEYDTEEDVRKAVCKGEADCFLVRSSRAVNFMKDGKLHPTSLLKSDNITFAVKRGNANLMTILNKTLKSMPSSMLRGALAMYDNASRKVTVLDFVRDNFLIVSALMIAVVLVILLIVCGFLRKALRAETKARQAAEKSQELNQKLQVAIRQAEKANAAKTTFLSNMSHDIRTPMNAIVGITNLMEHETGISEKMQSYIQKIQTSSHHLLSLINDILDMSRIEANEIVLNQEEVSLPAQIGQIDSIIRAQTNERHQKLYIYANDIRHEDLICDGVRLRQIFLNLLSNAVKYTPEGGTITMELTEVPCDIPGRAAFVGTVTDNGYGMTQEFIGHMFDPFTRAENSMTNKVQGSGLGMTITKNIVDQMGGEIHVKSEIGKGSCFEVRITLRINADADHEAGAEKILLVSEDKRLIQNVEATMEESHVSVSCVADEKKAEKWLMHETADVILLSRMSGGRHLPEIVGTLRKRAKNSVLIFGIDYARENETEDTLRESGMDGIIPRPFFRSNLALAIARIRTSSAGRTENRSILTGMRFLCAEDNELNAEILRDLLSMHGASCTIYTDGEALVNAFKKLKPGDYDAILMDVQMPKMNGIEATKAIRNGENPLGKTIPIIAMTANAFSEDVQLCIGAGMDVHISKPLDMAVLEKALRFLAGGVQRVRRKQTIDNKTKNNLA